MKTLKDRLAEIKQLKKEECWYITKQSLTFRDLCFAAKIVDDFIENGRIGNFEQFFTREIEKNHYPISKNHRMTNNCYYLGLLEKEEKGGYKDAKLTAVYLHLKTKYQSNFSSLDSNDEIVVSQIEKVFISNPFDNESNDLRSGFQIHPAFYIYKILLLIGEQTSNFKITLNEFKKFVGTSKKYSDYLATVGLILESRDNSKLDKNLDYLLDYYQAMEKIDSSLFSTNRFNLLLKNLPYLEINASSIQLKKESISLIRKKVFDYESNYSEEHFTLDFLNSTNYITSTNLPSTKSTRKKANTPEQTIYFGAPGTGKSHLVNERLKGLSPHQIERITFHPDYDYHSFVGGYKPAMEEDNNGKENIKYKFVPQVFTKIYKKAWDNNEEDYYLVIEEINRGNCAEIFGDIFQLLDRSKSYEITPSKELGVFLSKKLRDKEFGFKNEKMCLPPNLHILATMNTSDQSLFPMDSAFKRRWNWEYVPINYDKNKEKNESAKYQVQLSDEEYFSWLNFIEKVNKKIKSVDGLGMDKCVGNYFIKPPNTTISLQIFINKAIFYLWEDVFKDEPEDSSIFKNQLTYEDFFPIQENGVNQVRKILEELDVVIVPEVLTSES